MKGQDHGSQQHNKNRLQQHPVHPTTRYARSQVGLEKGNAITEVTRYVQTPTQPMSYLIGKVEILRLRKDYEAKMGDKFNLKEFHDKLISYGSIPVQMVYEQMVG